MQERIHCGLQFSIRNLQKKYTLGINCCSEYKHLPWYAQLFLIFFFVRSLDVFFILVDKEGVALSGAEALAVLDRSDVLARLRAYGYQATGYEAVVPPVEESPVKSGNHPVMCDECDMWAFFSNPMT